MSTRRRERMVHSVHDARAREPTRPVTLRDTMPE